MTLCPSSTANDALAALVDSVTRTIQEILPQPVSIFYSGGSGLKIFEPLYESLKDVELSDVIFAPVDERKEFSRSNARQLSEMVVYQKFLEKGATFVDLGDLDRSLDEVADAYGLQIKTLFDDIAEHEGTIIAFLGMGSDGHTAGIFPYPEDPDYFDTAFVSTERYVVGYDVGDKNPYNERVTLTVPALLLVDYAFAYVTGEDKREALEKVRQNGSLAEVPARVWQQMKSCNVYTDISLS